MYFYCKILLYLHTCVNNNKKKPQQNNQTKKNSNIKTQIRGNKLKKKIHSPYTPQNPEKHTHEKPGHFQGDVIRWHMIIPQTGPLNRKKCLSVFSLEVWFSTTLGHTQQLNKSGKKHQTVTRSPYPSPTGVPYSCFLSNFWKP